MGLEEARVREQVATALEEAIESGNLSPESRGFARRQVEVAKVALREPWDGGDGRSRLRAVQDERLEGWLQRGPGGRADARRTVLDGVAAAVSAEPPAIDPDAARSALEPTLWLLERGNDGIGLTQTGALNRAWHANRWFSRGPDAPPSLRHCGPALSRPPTRFDPERATGCHGHVSSGFGFVVRDCYLACMTLTAKVVSGNEVRVPDPQAGEVTVISRYGKERAMLVHPDDFHRLDELDRMLAEAAELPSLEPTHEALRAHLEEGTPSEPITDPAALAELFG